MPDLVIRPARLDDLSAMRSVDPGFARDPNREPVLTDVLALGQSWLAEGPGGALLGYAAVSRRFFNRPFVDLLFVDEAARRQGIGEALMARCEAGHDDDRMFTSTNESNAPMRALLAKRDWRVSGIIENLDPGDPEIVYVTFRDPA